MSAAVKAVTISSIQRLPLSSWRPSILVEFLNPPFNVGFEAVITGFLREIQCSFKVNSCLYIAA